MIVDLSPLSFIESAGLHALLSPAGGEKLAELVCPPTSSNARLLGIVEAEKAIRVFPDLDTALEAMPR